MTFPTFKDKRYYPEEVDVVVGTIDAGDRFSLREDDGDVLEISELAATPGFDIVLTFKRVVAPWNTKKLKLIIDGYYDGASAHEVKLYFWDYLAEAWAEVTGDAKDLPDAIAAATYTFEFEGDSDGHPSEEKMHGGTGEVKIRIVHNDAGDAAHDIFLEKVSLGFSSFEATAM